MECQKGWRRPKAAAANPFGSGGWRAAASMFCVYDFKYYSVLYYSVLYYSVLYYSVLYYSVLYYSVLY